MNASTTETFDIKIDDRDLPVLSAIATQALNLITAGNPTGKDLEELIRKDLSLASRILRLANSPLYGGRVKSTSIAQSAVRLGMTRLKSVILIAAVGDVFDKSDPHARAFWEHGLGVAYTSFWLSEMLQIAQPEDCFVGGMLHDLGKVVIYRQQPKAYGALIDEARGAGVRFYKHERPRLLFCPHETVGALVARKWELSPEIVEVVGFHHEIEEREDCVTDAKPMVALVSAANLLSGRLGFGADAAEILDPLGSKPAAIIGLTAELVEICEQNLGPILKEELAALR